MVSSLLMKSILIFWEHCFNVQCFTFSIWQKIAIDIAVLMLVKCIRVGAIRQFALRSVPHQIDNCYSDRTAEGEVIPGIGGMIYERLGFNGQPSKNEYV